MDVPGPLTDALARSRSHGLWLVPGSVYERGDGDLVHNTCLVFSPHGELVARYRKVFPRPQEACAPGDRFTTFESRASHRAVDLLRRQLPRDVPPLAWMGAEVVLKPSLTTTSDRDQELVMARANVIFNQFYVVSLNAAAPAGIGRKPIVDPEGLVRVQAGDGEELLTDVLDLAPSRACVSTGRRECRAYGPVLLSGCVCRRDVTGQRAREEAEVAQRDVTVAAHEQRLTMIPASQPATINPPKRGVMATMTPAAISTTPHDVHRIARAAGQQVIELGGQVLCPVGVGPPRLVQSEEDRCNREDDAQENESRRWIASRAAVVVGISGLGGSSCPTVGAVGGLVLTAGKKSRPRARMPAMAVAYAQPRRRIHSSG